MLVKHCHNLCWPMKQPWKEKLTWSEALEWFLLSVLAYHSSYCPLGCHRSETFVFYPLPRSSGLGQRTRGLSSCCHSWRTPASLKCESFPSPVVWRQDTWSITFLPTDDTFSSSGLYISLRAEVMWLMGGLFGIINVQKKRKFHWFFYFWLS